MVNINGHLGEQLRWKYIFILNVQLNNLQTVLNYFVTDYIFNKNNIYIFQNL